MRLLIMTIQNTINNAKRKIDQRLWHLCAVELRVRNLSEGISVWVCAVLCYLFTLNSLIDSAPINPCACC